MAGCAHLSALRSRLLRILAVARVELLHLMHDATSISLILIIPAVQIVLFGYAVNLTPKNIPIAISRRHGAATDQVRKTVEETGYFVIEADGLPPGGAREMVVRGKALVGIEVPPVDGSSSEQASADPSIIVDASDPEAVRPALTALENAYLRHVAEIFAIGPVPEAKVVYLFNPMSETAWAIVPGLVGVVVMITMLVLGALTLVRERERGSWEALLATPVDAIDALAGKLSPYVLVGIVQAAVVIWLAHLLFDLPVDGMSRRSCWRCRCIPRPILYSGSLFRRSRRISCRQCREQCFSIFRRCCCRDFCSRFKECRLGPEPSGKRCR